MIGTLTWHFHNCVVIGTEQDTCEHAIYKEYDNLEIMLTQQSQVVTPAWAEGALRGNGRGD